MGSYGPEQDKLGKILQECSSDDDFEDSDSSDDNMHFCNSESESQGSDIYTNILKCPGRRYKGNGKSVWQKNPPIEKTRSQKKNIILHLPCVKSSAKHAKLPIDCFSLFVDESLINQITMYTNIFIQDNAFNYSKDGVSKLTNEAEVKAVIGLLILAGLYRSGHRNLVDLWQKNGLGMEIFWAAMSLKRFRFLLGTLRFDDITTRERRKKYDRFAPFREFFDRFMINCRTYYSASEYTTIDTQLVPFRGPCSFRQYSPKCAKRGLKIFTLCDAKTWYTISMEVHVKTQPAGPFKVSNLTTDVVNRLVKPIEGSGRNVTINNWFCDVPLAEKLLKKNITLVGTFKSNEKDLPNRLRSDKNRNKTRSLGSFRKDLTIVSYLSEDDKSDTLISSMRTCDDTNSKTVVKNEPEIVTIYGMTRGGVDTVNQMCSKYSTQRNTKRWPLALFYRMIDIAGINAHVVYTYNCKEKSINRRTFLKTIGISLVIPTLRNRAETLELPRLVQESARRLSGGPTKQVRVERPKPVKVKRCVICPRKMDRKVRTFCCKCLRGMCLMHMNYVCGGCMNTDSSVIDSV